MLKASRCSGLLISAGLHLAALSLAWWGWSRPPSPQPPTLSVSAMIIPARAARIELPRAVRPSAAAPALRVEASTARPALLAAEIAAELESAAPGLILALAPALPAAAAPQLVPASLPPEHRPCSASSTERHYPSLLRERGLQGLVMLLVQVDEQGRAAQVQLKQGSGLRLFDEAAARVAQACNFIPARRGEQAVASWVEYPVRFALRNSSQ